MYRINYCFFNKLTSLESSSTLDQLGGGGREKLLMAFLICSTLSSVKVNSLALLETLKSQSFK